MELLHALRCSVCADRDSRVSGTATLRLHGGLPRQSEQRRTRVRHRIRGPSVSLGTAVAYTDN